MSRAGRSRPRLRSIAPFLTAILLVGACDGPHGDHELVPAAVGPLLDGTFDGAPSAAPSGATSDATSIAFELPAATFVRLELAQHGADLALRLVGPDGTSLTIDSFTGSAGVERLETVSARAGIHRAEVVAVDAATRGRFSLRLETVRPATADDHRRADAGHDDMDSMSAWQRRDFGAAAAAAERARTIYDALGDEAAAARMLGRIGRAQADAGDPEHAVEPLTRAAATLARLGDRAAAAQVQRRLARALLTLGRARQALAAARAANTKTADTKTADTKTVNPVAALEAAQALHLLGDLEAAREVLLRAADSWRAAGDATEEATARHDLGVVELDLGRPERALDHLLRAEALYARAGARRERAVALRRLAETRRRLGDHDAARRLLHEALALRRALGDRRGEALTLSNLSQLDRRDDRHDEARAQAEQALTLLEQVGDRHAAATVRVNLGYLEIDLDRPARALPHFDAAIATLEELDDRSTRLVALQHRAEALLRLGRLDEAEVAAGEAVEGAERALVALPPGPRRAHFLASMRRAWDLHVEVLLTRHLESPRPATGDPSPAARRAFAVSERARARWLLDGIGAGRTDDTDDSDDSANDTASDTAQATREHTLGDTLLELDALRRRLAPDDPRRQAAAARWRTVLDELEDLRAARLEDNASGTASVELDDIRRQLPPGTTLLALHLGPRRSAAWIVRHDGVALHALPAGEELEELARTARRLTARSHRRESAAAARRALCALAAPFGEVLHEAIDEVGNEVGNAVDDAVDDEPARLVLVPDGALWLVPWAALPVGDCSPDGARADPAPLLEHAELSLAPSASLLVHRAGVDHSTRAAARSLAVLAAPRYVTWTPLPGSRAEADAVLAAAPADARAFVGAAASRRLVLGGGLDDFRIVHFATHAVADAIDAQRSAIVLSEIDADGRRVDGILRAHELPALSLRAELVVLSGCRTGLGRAVRGEGLVGLAHGFLRAGVPRLVTTLWEVDDGAAAALAGPLHRGLHADLPADRTPAGALRAAQRVLRRSPEHAAPAHWAGWIVHDVDSPLAAARGLESIPNHTQENAR